MPEPSRSQARLESILAVPEEARRASVQARFQAISQGRELHLVFLGAKFLGHEMVRIFRRVGLQPIAFADNNPELQGTEVEGLPVFSPLEAVNRFKDRALFVPTVFTNGPALKQLIELGAPTVPLNMLMWQYADTLLPYSSVCHPNTMAGKEDRIRKALPLWSDEASLEEYLGQIQWRRTLDRDALPAHEPAGDIYYPLDLLNPSPEEVFVDCGAYDGDTLKAFLPRWQSAFRRFIGIEADTRNLEKLQATISSLPTHLAARCRTLRFAVGKFTGTVRFAETGTWGSSIVETSTIEVPASRLDDLQLEEPPTYIKMDVEGAEPDVLEGARSLISRHRPILAVCLYHRPEDLWDIPLQIHAICPEYRFFLRRYSDENWEQVCYAIPMERCR
jgi:FkbM family methyltransferase